MLLLNESFLLCTYINLNTFETCVDCTRQVQSTPTATCAYSFLIQVQNSWQLVPVPGKASLNSVAPELEIGYLPNVIQMSGIAQLIANAFAKQTPLLLFLLLSFVLRLARCHTAAGQAAFQQNNNARKRSKSECFLWPVAAISQSTQPCSACSRHHFRPFSYPLSSAQAFDSIKTPNDSSRS